MDTYDLTQSGITAGPVNPAFQYSLNMAYPAPWFQLAIFVGPKEYDLSHLPPTADLTFWSASPLNLGMIGFFDGRDSINYLWSRSEIDIQAKGAPALFSSVPEPGPFLLLAAALCAVFWRTIWRAVR